MKHANHFMSSAEATINERLRSHKMSNLTREACVLIYGDIFDVFASIFEEAASKTNVQLTNEAVNWLSQRLYDDVRVNGGQMLDPTIFEKRASLKSVPTTDLAVLLGIMKGHPYCEELSEEMKSRN